MTENCSDLVIGEDPEYIDVSIRSKAQTVLMASHHTSNKRTMAQT